MRAIPATEASFDQIGCDRDAVAAARTFARAASMSADDLQAVAGVERGFVDLSGDAAVVAARSLLTHHDLSAVLIRVPSGTGETFLMLPSAAPERNGVVLLHAQADGSYVEVDQLPADMQSGVLPIARKALPAEIVESIAAERQQQVVPADMFVASPASASYTGEKVLDRAARRTGNATGLREMPAQGRESVSSSMAPAARQLGHGSRPGGRSR